MKGIRLLKLGIDWNWIHLILLRFWQVKVNDDSARKAKEAEINERIEVIRKRNEEIQRRYEVGSTAMLHPPLIPKNPKESQRIPKNPDMIDRFYWNAVPSKCKRIERKLENWVIESIRPYPQIWKSIQSG